MGHALLNLKMGYLGVCVFLVGPTPNVDTANEEEDRPCQKISDKTRSDKASSVDISGKRFVKEEINTEYPEDLFLEIKVREEEYFSENSAFEDVRMRRVEKPNEGQQATVSTTKTQRDDGCDKDAFLVFAFRTEEM
ncbi:hypothetical protein M0802_010418 [Mischocyttarus mexicanus]|nr:hypothetical protein M0802_010418 [Mischocyttarus mexicanus]